MKTATLGTTFSPKSYVCIKSTKNVIWSASTAPLVAENMHIKQKNTFLHWTPKSSKVFTKKMLKIDFRNQIDASFHVLRQFELKSDKISVGRKIPEYIFFLNDVEKLEIMVLLSLTSVWKICSKVKLRLEKLICIFFPTQIACVVRKKINFSRHFSIENNYIRSSSASNVPILCIIPPYLYFVYTAHSVHKI